VPLRLVEIGTSVAVGLVDNVLVELEERGQITGDMTKIKDVVRLAGAFGGLVVNAFIARPGTALDTISGSLAMASMPLALHTIRRTVKEVLTYGGLRLVPYQPPQVQVVYQPPPPTPAPVVPVATLTSY